MLLGTHAGLCPNYLPLYEQYIQFSVSFNSAEHCRMIYSLREHPTIKCTAARPRALLFDLGQDGLLQHHTVVGAEEVWEF